MRKSIIVALAAVVAFAALVPAAFAAEAEDDHRVSLEGRGALWAGGSGRVEVSGAGRARLAVDGDVTVVDRAGDARIWVRGVPAAADTTLTLEGFRGTVRVVGSDFTVEAEGRILLGAAGRGSARLEGTGWYRVRHDGWGHWPAGGFEVAYPG